MEQNEYYETSAPCARTYTNAQKWLLLAALVIGIVFDRLIINRILNAGSVNEFAPYYGAFWLIYILAFYSLTWKTSSKKTDAWILLGAVALLFLRYAVYEQQYLGFINLLVIPCLLMLHCAAGVYDVQKGKETRYFGLFFAGWFIRPFSAFGHFVSALASALSGGKGSVSRKILLGLLAAVPVAAVVIALLINADEVMSFYGSKIFGDFNAAEFIIHSFIALIAAVLFYSFLYNAAWGKHELKQSGNRLRIDRVGASVVLIVLIIAYAVFAYVQFAYLFGLKGLPDGLTYSEYARKGFTELLWVAAINLIVFAAFVNCTESTPLFKALLFSLLGFTLVVLFSGIVRLLMYIGAYNLTMMRILPMWFMIFLVFAVLLCAVKLIEAKTKLVRILFISLLVWYIALNAVNLDAVIAKSIIANAPGGVVSENDKNYILYSLSSDADAVREQYREKLMP